MIEPALGQTQSINPPYSFFNLHTALTKDLNKRNIIKTGIAMIARKMNSMKRIRSNRKSIISRGLY